MKRQAILEILSAGIKNVLRSLHRDKGYIHATLKLSGSDDRLLSRKLLVIIDPNTFQAINAMDNRALLEQFDQWPGPGEIKITKHEAYAKLKEWITLQPYYVYNFIEKQYILCGKLDCDYGVNAETGEVIPLRE